MKTQLIFCCGCGKDTNARLTTGREIYAHRTDLSQLPFWVCDSCKNYVGCHHKTKDRTRPLGIIPTAKIREMRKRVHAVIDPIWKNGELTRKQVYLEISKLIGCEYHTADLKDENIANKIIDWGRCS